DQALKINGHRISPEEIESALNEVPGVASAAIRKERVKGRERLACFLEAEECVLDVRSIRNFVASRLPGYMIPRVYHRVESIPRLASGKLDRVSVERLTGERLLSTSVDRTTDDVVAESIL